MNISVYRVSLIKERTLPYAHAAHVLSPKEVYELITEYLQGTDREHFIAIFLDSRSAVIGMHTVSVGTLTESLVHLREVFKGAILANAASIIVAHNHPSGEPLPSEADLGVTTKLTESGRLLGIPLEDHVVIGPEGFTSFRQAGLL